MSNLFMRRKKGFDRISSRPMPRPALLGGMVLFLVASSSSWAQTITTMAGNGAAAFSGDNGQAILASLNSPRGVAVDSQGNIYVADTLNHRIRRVGVSGTITTAAGNGTAGFSGDGGQATNAQLNQPEDIWVDASGNLYIADSSNHRIREVTAGGMISTIAGIGSFGYNGDGIAATSAQLNRPTSIVLDAAGNLFIADSSNHRIRRVSVGGTISTVAGNGVQAYSGENVLATSASLRFPIGITIDSGGNLYIADAGNHVVRRVNPSGTINTVAGNGLGAGTDTGTFSGDGGAALSAGLNTPEDVAIDSSGNLFIADTANYRIRRVSGGVITTIAGTGFDGFAGDGGPAAAALLNLPRALSLDAGGNLLIADMLNQRIRRIAGAGSAAASPGVGPNPAGSGNPPAIASGGIVDGASFRGTIAAGAIVSIFGQNLSTTPQSANQLPLPPSMGGTSVTINGVTAPAFYVSSTQVNVQLPFSLSSGAASVVVTRDGVSGPPQGVTVSPFSPAIFTVPSGGTGPGAILHNGSGVLVTASAPAARGEYLSIYCTGLGSLQGVMQPGVAAPSNPPIQTSTLPSVSIGGVVATPVFAGLAPGFAGLYQVNVQVPQGVPSGNALPVFINIGGIVSNTVTLAVQ
jgi:uncharacterized protein (TIGR03437 family)